MLIKKYVHLIVLKFQFIVNVHYSTAHLCDTMVPTGKK